MDISIHNTRGEIVSNISINDDLTFLNGRVSKGHKCYYKGVGVPYKSHYGFTETINDDYIVLEQPSVFYNGYKLFNKNYQGKFGIFQERYQPIFTDFIGTCGAKERLIVSNSLSFEKSSVDIFDCIEIDTSNEQYYFELNYLCQRKSYLSFGTPKRLTELLEYMLVNKWNFLWDKNVIRDISGDGRVSDVADLFQSDELKYQLGTVYALLYSLSKNDMKKYSEFLKYNKLTHRNDMSFISNAIWFMKKYHIDISPLLIGNSDYEIYKNVLVNYLLVGKNCAHCSCDFNKPAGDRVAQEYLKKFSETT